VRLLPRPRRRERRPRARPAERFLLAGAQQSVSFGHAYVGTEHVLLALAEDPATPAARVLAQFGLTGTVLRARRRTRHRAGRRPAPPRDRPQALATLGLATRAAGDGPPASEHMLVSLAAVEDSAAARILGDHGVTLTALRDALA
jgi:ATP-dependent Clp protease ATP-binding subunit ClpA